MISRTLTNHRWRSIWSSHSYDQKTKSAQTNTFKYKFASCAVTLSVHNTLALGSIYLPPRYALDKLELDNLLNQLPTPFILLGDTNTHSTIWGHYDTNDKGNKLEKFIEDNDLCLWKDNSLTYILFLAPLYLIILIGEYTMNSVGVILFLLFTSDQ